MRRTTYQDDTIESLLEPGLSILLLDLVRESNPRASRLSYSYTSTRTSHDNIKVHSKDTNTGIVSGTKIDVFLDTKAKVARLREVASSEFVFFYFQATLENFLSFGTTDGDVDGDLLVTTDTERSDSVAGFGGDGGLTGELFEHLGGSGQTITRLANGDVCVQFVPL